MAFVLKKNQDFQFQIEGTEKTYTIPAIDTFNVDEIEVFRKLQDTKSLRANLNAIRHILLEKMDDREGLNLSDYQWLMIINAYSASQNANGASSGEL